MSKTVMVIDDSASFRTVVKLALQKASYEVVEAGDGEDAVKKLDGRKLSCIVCDVNMPRMDGISFVKHLKTTNYKFVPVIMLTTRSLRTPRRPKAVRQVLAPGSPSPSSLLSWSTPSTSCACELMNISLQGELTVHRISDHHMFLLEQIAQVSSNEPVVRQPRGGQRDRFGGASSCCWRCAATWVRRASRSVWRRCKPTSPASWTPTTLIH